MAARKLVPGSESGSMASRKNLEAREREIRDTVEKYLPEFVSAVRHSIRTRTEDEPDGAIVMMHQDGFAAAYDEDEYILLAMAVKYAGLHGIQLMFAGRSQETYK